MIINRLKKTVLLFSAFAACLTACDNVDEGDRYIELEHIDAKRAVLLEEFTGQDCTNCPEGHRIAAQLKEQYGDAFIPVSIHASQLSWSEEEFGEYGLGIAEGDAYYKANSSPALPSGVVDRNSGVLNRTDWAAKVRSEMEKEAPAAIEIVPVYDTDSKKINIDIILKPTANLNCNLTVWILESGIVNYQYDNGNHVTEYVHNHVLRDVVSDVWGDQVELSTGVFSEKKYQYDIVANGKTHWNTDNLSVVAFLSTDKGVLQAAEAHVSKVESDNKETEE